MLLNQAPYIQSASSSVGYYQHQHVMPPSQLTSHPFSMGRKYIDIMSKSVFFSMNNNKYNVSLALALSDALYQPIAPPMSQTQQPNLVHQPMKSNEQTLISFD